MGESGKPKRPHPKPEGHRSHPPARDARVERPSPDANGAASSPLRVLNEHEARPQRTGTGPRNTDGVAARIAALELELARLGEERGAEADELARMLVRVADAERARVTAEERSAALAERVRELETQSEQGRRENEAMRHQARRSAEMAEMASRRAGLAEKSASDGAAALERAGAQLEADRTRLTDLEARLARTRREHLAEVAALRVAHEEASSQTNRALEEERASGVQARQQAIAAQAELSALREAVAKTSVLVDELERREEMTAALRARALREARRILGGQEPPGSVGREESQLDAANLELPEQ
jgi:chromosome segregation ATPase